MVIRWEWSTRLLTECEFLEQPLTGTTTFPTHGHFMFTCAAEPERNNCQVSSDLAFLTLRGGRPVLLARHGHAYDFT